MATYRDFDITTTTETIVLGSACGGGLPDTISISAENVLPFAADNDSTVTLFGALTRGDDIGTEAADFVWEAIVHLSRTAPSGQTDDGTWYGVTLRWNLTDTGASAYIHLPKVVAGAVVIGQFATWAKSGFRGVLAPSGGSAYPAYGTDGWPIRYRVLVSYADMPPVDETPDPLDDHIYAPTDLAVEFIAPAGADPAIARLTWTDNADNELGFVVERRELTGDAVWYEMYRPEADVVTWDDREVLPGTIPNPELQYRVYAYKATLRSTDSNLATLSLVDEVDPPHPAAWATAPIVNPGPAIVVTGPPPATRTTAVTVTRGRLNGDLTYGWAQVSGPVGNATISDPDALTTDVVFASYVPGRYVLEVTVTTEALVGTALVGTGRATFVIAPTRGPIVSGGNSQVTP
jgi:hypothetical protein